MNLKTSQVSDEENTAFVPQSANLTNASAGFDASEQQAEKGQPPTRQHRFPRRKSKDEIPQEPLADRLRAKR